MLHNYDHIRCTFHLMTELHLLIVNGASYSVVNINPKKYLSFKIKFHTLLKTSEKCKTHFK